MTRIQPSRSANQLSLPERTAGSRFQRHIAILLCSCAIGTVCLGVDSTSSPSVADAFVRLNFVANLKPVAWHQVRADALILANAIAHNDQNAADALIVRIDWIEKSQAIPPPPVPDADLPPDAIDIEPEVVPDAEAARQVLELATGALTKLLVHYIELASNPQSGMASAHLETGRQVFAAFEPYLSTFDPAALSRLLKSWQELQVLAETSAHQSDAESVHRAWKTHSAEITTYFVDNFGPGFRLVGDPPYAPVPLSSSTAIPKARRPRALPPGSRVSKPLPRPRQILNSVERGALESDMPLSTLGAIAFNNPFVFGEPAATLGITCNTCHDKSGTNPAFFIPGLSRRPGGVDVTNSFFAPHANNAIFDPLDIPDLRGIRYTAPYGRNGRIASLRDFARHVIVNEFAGSEPDPLLLDGIVVYLMEFDFVRNPALNGDGTLNQRASDAARRGEVLFHRVYPQMGNRSCASCHIPSSSFLDHLQHDVGTVQGYAEFSRDRALDMPTLLGTVATAPYFHDGSMSTLRDVVDWFNQRFDLQLSMAELADLTSYVSTIGNGIHVFLSGDRFVADDMEDQESFLSSFEFLAERGKWDLITILFRGIAYEMRIQQANALDDHLKTVFAKMAETMDTAAQRSSAGAHDDARAGVKAWRELYRLNRYEFR